MSEQPDVVKLTVSRTVQPKAYHSIKIGLEIMHNIRTDAETYDEIVDRLYKTMKKKLNEIEQYEMERMK